MYDQKYFRQVDLLLRCLPTLRGQSEFAIKGGTAINLLVHDLPRLSVDIDLTFTMITNREASLEKIQQNLLTLKSKILKQNPEVRVTEKVGMDQLIKKLFVYHQDTMIKIEPNFTLRGTLYPIKLGNLCKNIGDLYNVFIDEIPMLTEAELYAGKLCAALDRQHPRDLFDVKILFETSGITNEMRQAFVIYLAGNNRPIHELLAPNKISIQSIFENEFIKMTTRNTSVNELLEARERLINYMQKTLTPNERQFLLSVKLGAPQYDLMPFDNLQNFPSLQWKLINISRMDKQKHKNMLRKLQTVLEI